MAAHCPLTAFLCLAAALLTTGASQAEETNDHGCPEGWTLFGTRCFKFFESKLTWTRAEKSCQSHGANLASIHSAEENAFVVDVIKEATGGHRWSWIGGHDAVKENLWMWTDGSVWDYLNWSPRQPSNSGGKEHVAMINWRDTLWNDEPEDKTMDYICAKDSGLKAEPKVTLGDVLYQCAPMK